MFYTHFLPLAQLSFTARLPALALSVFHLYDSADSPLTLRSDSLLRLSGWTQAGRAVDPLQLRTQAADDHRFYIRSRSLTLGFSGATGLLEVRGAAGGAWPFDCQDRVETFSS